MLYSPLPMYPYPIPAFSIPVLFFFFFFDGYTFSGFYHYRTYELHFLTLYLSSQTPDTTTNSTPTRLVLIPSDPGYNMNRYLSEPGVAPGETQAAKEARIRAVLREFDLKFNSPNQNNSS